MIELFLWAKKWGIPAEAIYELSAHLGVSSNIEAKAGDSEAAVQSQVRIEASQKGCRLWRNNVGACEDKSGRHIRYGLANESKKMNENIKSSDLIGIRPVTITPEMVGHTIGQFVAREVKAGAWKYRATEREMAQLRFLNLITSMGGDASFATSEGTL